jgi:YfiH family protein
MTKTEMLSIETIPADWRAPRNVIAHTTTRQGGVSTGAYASLNLGDHVGDDPETVARNRALLREALRLPGEPVWLKQVHGTEVVDAATATAGVAADGAWTDRRGVVLAILTADCLPVFLCDKAGTRIALLHAGWRGLVDGVIEAGVRALGVPAGELLAYLGPAIGPAGYEVGDEVREAFTSRDPRAGIGFLPRGNGRWAADLYGLAQRRLHALGVVEVSYRDRCTCGEPEVFYSYRRDGVTGRMASLMWLE